MQNTELSDIEASVQTLVRRAYELGRNDVLKRVVDVLKTDHPITEQLALTGPRHEGPHHDGPHHDDVPAPMHEKANGAAEPVRTAERPWWAWPVR